MKFILKPSLEHMTLVQIVNSLWNQNDVEVLILKYSSENLYSKNIWRTMEEKVIEKVSQLSLPQPLKDKVICFIRPIGIEISMWMENNYKYLPAYLPAKLFWTPQGTIDWKRTAEVLIGDENLNVVTGYRLACDYCLEDNIIKFWNRLPENLKNYNWHNSPVISFWSDNMKRRNTGHISCKNVFYSSVCDSNKVAAKYFLKKLTPQEREECIKELSKDMDNADALYFLLPELKEEEQKEVFKNNPVDVLQYFLHWPWQSFFLRVANCMWDFLSNNNYDETFVEIIHKIREGYKDYNYQNLFREFWQESPSSLKDSFIEKIDSSRLLKSLFDIKDKGNMRLILKDATLTAKAKLIYSEKISDYLIQCICKNEWGFLEFFIQECLPSISERLKFKEEFEKYICFKECSSTDKLKWNQFYCFSDDSIHEYGKRCLEEAKSSSSKRFQSLQ